MRLPWAGDVDALTPGSAAQSTQVVSSQDLLHLIREHLPACCLKAMIQEKGDVSMDGQSAILSPKPKVEMVLEGEAAQPYRVLEMLRQCLRTTEHAVTGGRSRNPTNAWLAELADVTWNGFALLLVGGKLISKRLAMVAALAVALLIYVSIMEGGALWSVTPLCVFLGAALVTLSPTSRVALLDVSEAATHRVCQLIEQYCLTDRALDILGGAIEVALTRSSAWIGTLRAFMAIVWGVLFWFLCERVFGLGLEPKAQSEAMALAVIASLCMFMSLGALAAYSAAVSATHLTLRIALAQAKMNGDARHEQSRNAPK